MLSPVGHDDIAADLPITFARLDGLDLRRAADGWHGVWQAGDIAHQFWLPEAMPDAAAFYAVTLPVDSLLELRIHAARRLWRSLTRRPPGPPIGILPDQLRQWHVLSLRALDARLCGESYRAIPADPIIVRQNWLRAYEWTTDRGAAALNDYARSNDPFTKVGKQQIAVEVSSVIRASNDSFRVAWTERHYENGQLSTTERWTAILTIVIQTPRDAERLRANPLGIYVNAISWSREMSQ